MDKDAQEYHMKNLERGNTIIFNNDTFECGKSYRKGSKVDVNNLKEAFSNLDFEVKVHENLSANQVMEEIDLLSKADYTDHDCICIVMLTHGIGSDYLLACDYAYHFCRLWKPFTADKCTSLAGKPKIFILQACRGEQSDSGVCVWGKSPDVAETDSSVVICKVPTRADFVFAFSSVEGFLSYRNPDEGSRFIKALCEELNINGRHTHLLDMLTNVSRKVAVDYPADDLETNDNNNQKQVPSVLTNLLRKVYFPPKKQCD